MSPEETRALADKWSVQDVLHFLSVERDGRYRDAALAFAHSAGLDWVTDDLLHDGILWERHGFGVCSTGVCDEPCGPTGGCVR